MSSSSNEVVVVGILSGQLGELLSYFVASSSAIRSRGGIRKLLTLNKVMMSLARSTQASIDTFTEPVGQAVLLVLLGAGRAPSSGRSG